MKINLQYDAKIVAVSNYIARRTCEILGRPSEISWILAGTIKKRKTQ